MDTNILRKIAIDLLHFWDTYDLSMWRQCLIMQNKYLYINFIALKKTIDKLKTKQVKQDILNH